MAEWPAGLVSLMSPVPPPGEDPLAQLQRSMEAFTASTAPLVRRIEASAAALALMARQIPDLRGIFAQARDDDARWARAMAPGTAPGDLWIIFRGTADDDTRLQAADRMLARFGGFVHPKAYARMTPELRAQAEAHDRSAQQELHARAQAALFDTVRELGPYTPRQTTEALQFWRNRVQAVVLKDLLGDHWRRQAVPPRRGHDERHVWLELEVGVPGVIGGKFTVSYN